MAVDVDFENLIQVCEEKIRTGDDSFVISHIGALDHKGTPRKFCLPLANLSRRVGLIPAGLKFLSPVVRPKNKISSEPTPRELAEYAVLLQRNGSLEESQILLSKINANFFPEVLLYQALCHFNQWNYGTAIPLLERYLNHSLTPYQAIVGQVNLAAALIITYNFSSAFELLEATIGEARAGGWFRLVGNSHELKAQAHIASSRYSEARENLELSHEILQKTETVDSLFVMKWRAIVDGLERGELNHLLNFKNLAVEKREWESVREASLFELKIQSLHKSISMDQLNHLYFGTPFACYRKRTQDFLGVLPNAQEYSYGFSKGPKFDLLTGRFAQFSPEPEFAAQSIAPGKKVHQFLCSLLRDFYRPPNIGEIFAELFRGEYFDIFSSPARVHQILWRTRDWIRRSKIPVVIQNKFGAYTIRVVGPFSFQIPLNFQPINPNQICLLRLREVMKPGEAFSSTQAMHALAIKHSFLKSFAQWAIQKNDLVKIGAGSATLYVLNS